MTNGTEVWRPVPGYSGQYEVSNRGRVMSHRREAGHIMSLHINQARNNYRSVVLAHPETRQHKRYTVHRLVLLAFIGERPDGLDIRHLDGNPGNNHLSNLAYGTKSENTQDAIRHGTHNNASKTHCKNGHEFTDDNTIRDKKDRRYCRTCRKAYEQANLAHLAELARNRRRAKKAALEEAA